MIRRLFLYSILFYSAPSWGQNEMMTWINGWQAKPFDTTMPDTGDFQLYGTNIFSFKTSPPSITRHRIALSLWDCVVSMCDTNGNLLFYSNGSKIFNGNHELIENADSLNYNIEYNQWGDAGYYSLQHNSEQLETMICFRSLTNRNQYYILALYFTDYTNLPYRNTKIHYSLLDMSLNNGKGKLIQKEIKIDTGLYVPSIAATKHSDGKRWWILIPKVSATSNCYAKLLLDSTGFHIQSDECIGWNIDTPLMIRYHYSAVFSHDGKRFAFMTNSKGLEVYEFNRCTGTLFNRKSISYPFTPPYKSNEGVASMCFSPNNKFLYGGSGDRIFQFDVTATILSDSMIKVADVDTTPIGIFPYISFAAARLAPNGKIYFSTESSINLMHTIHNPDLKGIACNVKQRDVILPVYAPGIPHFPNYNLGAEKCCGFSINRILTIKPDTSLQVNDTGSYQWLSCDNSFKPIPNANQVSYKPKKSGRYAVRISNVFCTDTSECVYVMVDTIKVALQDVQVNDIIIYPNPANDIFYIQTDVQDLNYKIYDVLGRLILEEAINKQIDIKSLENGIYLVKIVDKYENEVHRENLLVHH